VAHGAYAVSIEIIGVLAAGESTGHVDEAIHLGMVGSRRAIVELHVALIPCRRQVLDTYRLQVKNLYLRAVLIDGARHRRREKRIASGIGGAQWQPVKLHRRVV